MRYNQILLLCVLIIGSDSSSSKYRQTIERVRNYLHQYDIAEEIAQKSFLNSSYLENSNKIGFGYDIISGSPVCYTASCQTTGFKRSIFKLNYVSQIPGSCISKLVPEHVEVDCLPSTTLNAGSETIATVEQLKKSMLDKIEVSVSASYLFASFSYSFSKETRSMIDNIVKHDRTSIFTTAQVSYVKLSLFEPQMQLADNFRYVIDNMPCCDADDEDIEEYVQDFIFDYFGFTYITSILLGGIAQQNIFIDRRTHERMVTEGVNTQHQAQLSFNFQFGASASALSLSSQEETDYKSFMSKTESVESTTFGGDGHFTTISDWSRTVKSNPVVVQFAVRDIFRLLVKHYFPNDMLISNKSALIKDFLNKRLKNMSTYCYDDCGGKNGTYGVCVPTEDFRFSQYQCKQGWTGANCLIPANAENKILQGTICGIDRSFLMVKCENRIPHSEGCPAGWIAKWWNTDLTVCYKNQTTTGRSVRGILCGIHVAYQSPNIQYSIPCNNKSIDYLVGDCPTSYQKANGYKTNVSYRNTVCASVGGENDLPGTICGMQIDGTTDGPTCDRYNPGLRQCPPKYSARFTMFNAMGFYVCVKG